jgi:hypothetical protein
MGATVEVNGTAVDADGTAAVDLDVGMNTITAMVTAQDGETMMTYTITVTRAASMDASLSALSLMDGDTEITLAMVADMPMKRTASVGNDVESVTVTATPNDMENAMAVIMPADADMDMDGHQVALMVGANEITVTVTAQDGETMMTYTMKRTASVGNDVESVTVTATPNDMENAMAVIMPADADMDMDGHQVDLWSPSPGRLPLTRSWTSTTPTTTEVSAGKKLSKPSPGTSITRRESPRTM